MKKRFADSLDWTVESTDYEVFHWYWKIYLSRFSSTIFFFLEQCSLPLTNSGHNMSSYMFMSLFNMILCGVCIILIIAVQFLLSEVSAKDLENPLFVSATVCRPFEILHDLRHIFMISVQLLGFFCCLFFAFFLGVKYASIRPSHRLWSSSILR